MSRISTLAIASTLLGGAALMPTTADAALVDIVFTTESLSDIPAANNVLEDSPFIDSRYDITYETSSTRLKTGYLESNVTGTIGIKSYFLGSESGFNNKLSIGNDGGADLTHTEADFSNLSGASFSNHGLFDSLKITANQTLSLDQRLKMFIEGGSAVRFDNDGSPANPSPGSNSSVLFGYALVTGTRSLQIVSYATNLILFALDDSGAGPDDNHDDYVGLLHVTPIPGAIFLFGPALAGLAWMRRRRLSGTPEALPA